MRQAFVFHQTAQSVRMSEHLEIHRASNFSPTCSGSPDIIFPNAVKTIVQTMYRESSLDRHIQPDYTNKTVTNSTDYKCYSHLEFKKENIM